MLTCWRINRLLHRVKTILNSIRSMSDADDDDSLERVLCDRLASADGARVAVRRSIRSAFDGLSDKEQGRFIRIMELWCENRPLAPNMFNHNEGRSNHHNLLIQAFKAFKIRLYGFERRLSGIRTFFIVDFDPAKKQDKADPIILKRAKSRLDDMVKEFDDGAGKRK